MKVALLAVGVGVVAGVASSDAMAVTHGAIVALLVWSIKTQIAQGKQIARLTGYLERK